MIHSIVEDIKETTDKTEVLETKTNLGTLDGQYECLTCSDILESRDRIEDHMRKFHSKFLSMFECNFATGISNKKELKYHKIGHSGEKPYECSICNEQFYTKHFFMLHINSKHYINKVWTCHLCQDVFYHRQTLIGHLVENHEFLFDQVPRGTEEMEVLGLVDSNQLEKEIKGNVPESSSSFLASSAYKE